MSFNGVISGMSRIVTLFFEFLARLVRGFLGQSTVAQNLEANQNTQLGGNNLESGFIEEEPFLVMDIPEEEEEEGVAVSLPTSVQEMLNLNQSAETGT